jgi:hypothetical protein
MNSCQLGLQPSRRVRAFVRLGLAFFVVAIAVPKSVSAGLVITPTFTTNFVTNFGANATAAENSWIAAANIFSSNFSDNIHINITVDGVAGTSVFGGSNTFINSTSYANLRNKLIADETTADDSTALGAGGSMTSADPVSGSHSWWVTRAEAKAIGLISDDLSNDGTTTFGAGNPFTFSGPIAAGTYDFEGVAAHEISEVMGRLGLSGGSNEYSLIDDFSFTGANTRGLGGGAGNFFSIDKGATLLKIWNNSSGTGGNGLDTRDWAPSGANQGGDGSNDSFNQFASSGVTEPVTTTDLRLMDVIGYDRIVTPEPGTLMLLAFGAGCVAFIKRRPLIAACRPRLGA